MQNDPPPNADFSPVGPLTEKSKNFQIALCSALVILVVAVVAVIFYIRNRPKSYRSNTVGVTTSIYLVDTTAAEKTLALRNPTMNPNSIFVSMILTDAELKSLLVENEAIAKALATSNREISMWPNQAFSNGFSKFLEPEQHIEPGRQVPARTSVVSSLVGFYGTCLDEDNPIFRVQLNSNTTENGRKYRTLTGTLLYEGDIPAGHLVFIGQLDDEFYQVIVIDAK